MAYTDPVTHVAGDIFPSSDWNTYIRDDLRWLHDQGGDLVGAATLPALTTSFHKVTGNTGISNIPAQIGTRLIVWFTGTPILTHTAVGGASGSLVLAGNANYTVAANDVLTFVCDSTGQWHEIGRRVSAAAAYAKTQSTPADPTGTTALTQKMMGLAGAITPTATGAVLITISGDATSSVAGTGGGLNFFGLYGTGAAPANGATSSGVQFCKSRTLTQVPAAASLLPFSMTGLVTGLTPSTAYWLDLAISAVTGGTASVKNITITATELP